MGEKVAHINTKGKEEVIDQEGLEQRWVGAQAKRENSGWDN